MGLGRLEWVLECLVRGFLSLCRVCLGAYGCGWHLRRALREVIDEHALGTVWIPGLDYVRRGVLLENVVPDDF